MANWPRVAVVGGSIGGLTAALLLRDLGCDVQVFERTRTALSSRGAGIVVHPATMRYLHQQGSHYELSTSAVWWRYLNLDGSVLFEEPCRYEFTAWNTLYRALLRELEPERYHLASEVVSLAQDADGVEVRLADGRQVHADLLVAADGVQSTARAQLLPDITHEYSGYVAWRGTVREADLSDATREAIHDAITYVAADSSHLLQYPIPDADGSTEPGKRLQNFVWYRNVAESELAALLTDRHGGRRAISLPPGAAADAFVDELRLTASRTFPAVIAELVTRTDEPFVQVIVDVFVPRMAFARVCLIGDAAFVGRPHAAVGTAKACVDAWALAGALAETDGDVREALARWEPRQLEIGRDLAHRSAAIGARYQFNGDWDPADPELRFGFGKEELDTYPETDPIPSRR
jgi:2,6-dihydroxypyridine 3-monooxygenase